MPRFRIYYGWYIVAASLLLIILDGLLLYSFGVFLPFLDADYGISRVGGSSIFAFRSIVLAFSLTLAGRLVDKYDPRVVVLVGGVIAAAGLLLSRFATEAWHFYLSYGFLIGLGDGVLYITCVTLVSRWFVKRRALVIGIITTGIPLSGFITPPLTEWLIRDFGTREAFQWLTVIFMVILMSALALRSYPSDMNLKPYGENGPETKGNNNENGGRNGKSWSLMEAIRTPVFWVMYAMYICGFITFLVVVIHLFSYAVDLGFPTAAAAFAPACIGIGSIVGRIIISGFVVEVMRSERVLFFCYILQGASIILILFLREIWAFYLFGLLFGVFYSGWVPIFPNLLGNFFGLNSLGSIYGFFGTSYSIAAITGPLIAGIIYKTTGSYHDAFLVIILFCAIAALGSFFIKAPKIRENTPEASISP